jgi:DNA-binding IscR family transcriptional regulator
MARLPEEVSILEVVEAIDGPIALNECTSASGTCKFGTDCPMRPIWCDTQDELISKLRSTNFSSVLPQQS